MSNTIRVSKHFGLCALLTVAAVIAMVPTTLRAETRVMVTFDRPVEVPGHVLPPGNYVFKTMDNNEIVTIYSGDERTFYATATLIPEDRPNPSDDNDTFVQLNKAKPGAPQQVDSYFVSGHEAGYQLVYPATHEAKHSK